MSINKPNLDSSAAQSFLVHSSGWRITGTIERNHKYNVEPAPPDFKRLSADRPGSKVARTAMADYCRLLADVQFWEAVATANPEAIDTVARRMVPAMPIWNHETWQSVAKLNPSHQYGLANWLSEHCFRVPYAKRENPQQNLETLINAWLDFDPDANWFQPDIAQSDALKSFVKAAAGFVTAKDHADKKYSINKRTQRHGQPRRITRTTRLIEGAHIYKNLPKKSISILQRQLRDAFGQITSKKELRDISESEARDAIRLFKAKRAVYRR